MATRAKILPKGHSRSQELQIRTSFTQILLKSDTQLHNTQALEPNMVFECSVLSKIQLQSKQKANKASFL